MRGVPILVLAMVAGRDRAGYPHGVGNQKIAVIGMQAVAQVVPRLFRV